jgi:WXXGXW repeat (2 copies)
MHSRLIRTLFFVVVMLTMSVGAFAAVVITVAPPALPIYEQPICPGDGYLWTPGYWGWDEGFNDYYFVPGTWVLAPEVGFLWTPGYWGWGGDGFVFYDGYWGTQVGFYGGINYGFGYFGNGFEGGRWDNGHFFYNRSVANVNVTNIHNFYETKVNNTNVNRISYNGGNGGINARPTAEQEAAARERHISAVAAQTQHAQEARSNPEQRASRNEGKPAIAATGKPGEFKGDGVVQAREAGAPYKRPANGGENQARENGAAPKPENGRENGTDANGARASQPGHVRDLPAADRPAAPNTGDAKLDKKYQQQQDKQYAKQQKERQKLQQKQEKEDQKVTKQNNDARKQQVEQQHQQQTQQLQQRHQQQSQQMQQRMQPPAARPNPSPSPRPR